MPQDTLVCEDQIEKMENQASVNEKLNYLKTFKSEMVAASNVTNKNIAETNMNLRVLDNKIEAIKEYLIEKTRHSDFKFAVMELRLNQIEEGAKKMQAQYSKTNKTDEVTKKLGYPAIWKCHRGNHPCNTSRRHSKFIYL